ncbi:AmpG permease [Enhygromyxa salina]|uniref:AmpG permease n=1 Tax=Enhygromyxa salina TaxID=215803 RepID=A0A0C1ZWG9_9BACT|nr:AmpG family muropeptide MFS transporter [Enhygromyxa salina]KIG15403.1 AmpG permease [Enhygromyxa salina]
MTDERTGSAPAQTPTPAPTGLRRAHAWVSTTYFAEGYPYSIVNNLADILFKELGASLQVVGLTSLFHLPWNLKFLWGPFVDDYETKRRWLLASEVAITIVIVLLGLLAAAGSASLVALAAGFVLLAMLSATHDIAIDGFYLEILSERDQSTFVGYRAAAYKVAALLVKGPLIAVCALLGWTTGLLGAALLMALLLGIHAWLLPKTETPQRPWTTLAKLASWRTLPFLIIAALLFAVERWWGTGSSLLRAWRELDVAPAWLAKISVGSWIGIALLASLLTLLAALPRLRRRMNAASERGLSSYASTFVSFLDQPKIGVMLAFVLLFRTGESFLLKMSWPFFDDVVGLELESYAAMQGGVGTLAMLAGTILGGRLIARDGLRKWIWPLVLAQNLLNLLYMALAMSPDPSAVSDTVVTALLGAENFGSGLGTAAFMVYLMRTCDPRHKAGHFAIVSALMSVSFTVAGVLSGFLADALGFATYFGFTFLATVPMMVLIFFVPHLDTGRATGE